MDPETKQLMHEIWSTSAKRWRESAEWWSAYAEATRADATRHFADHQMSRCLDWAREDEAKAERFK